MVIAGGHLKPAPDDLSVVVASTEPAMVIAGGTSALPLRRVFESSLQRSRRW